MYVHMPGEVDSFNIHCSALIVADISAKFDENL